MIGIFDSGVGGLSLVRELVAVLPGFSIVYFGDSARFPYGNKSPETVLHYSREILSFLEQKGAQLSIIACNTASTVADDLRQDFERPLFDVVHAACNEAVSRTTSGHIGVMGTAGTIRSRAHATVLRSLREDISVYEYPCPSLATLIEDHVISAEVLEAAVRSYLKELPASVDTLILGCTHYPLIAEMIQKVVGESVSLIDPAHAVVAEVHEYLQKHPERARELHTSEEHTFFVSDEAASFTKYAKQVLGKEVMPIMHRL